MKTQWRPRKPTAIVALALCLLAAPAARAQLVRHDIRKGVDDPSLNLNPKHAQIFDVKFDGPDSDYKWPIGLARDLSLKVTEGFALAENRPHGGDWFFAGGEKVQETRPTSESQAYCEHEFTAAHSPFQRDENYPIVDATELSQSAATRPGYFFRFYMLQVHSPSGEDIYCKCRSAALPSTAINAPRAFDATVLAGIFSPHFEVARGVSEPVAAADPHAQPAITPRGPDPRKTE